LKSQDDYTPLAVYICRQCRRSANEHRWKASRNLKKPIITETETHIKGELRIPRGAKALDIGKYDIESGNHYVRYVQEPKKKTQDQSCEKEGAGTGPKTSASGNWNTQKNKNEKAPKKKVGR
jgi:hypothetical protein